MYNFTPNYYPNLQNPYYNQQMQFNQPQIQQNQDQLYQDNNSGIIWVQGEAAAKAYPVLKNNTVALWDSESQTIYIKSVDNSGMPSMRIIEWNDKLNQNIKNTQENIVVNNNVDYVTREEFDEMVKKINNLSNKVGNNNKQKVNVKEETGNG